MGDLASPANHSHCPTLGKSLLLSLPGICSPKALDEPGGTTHPSDRLLGRQTFDLGLAFLNLSFLICPKHCGGGSVRWSG